MQPTSGRRSARLRGRSATAAPAAASRPSHIYATAGTYTAHVSVTDGSGNSAAQDVSVTVGSAQATLTGAKFSGKWKVSRYTNGTLTVAGTAPRAGKYTIDILKGKHRASSASRLNADRRCVHAQDQAARAAVHPGGYNIVLTPGDAETKGASTHGEHRSARLRASWTSPS